MKIIAYILVAYLSLNVFYYLFFSIMGHWPLRKKGKKHQAFGHASMAVLIPAYKEDAVIIQTVKQALLQHYPKDYHDIIVIADSLQPGTLAALKSYPVKVLEVAFEQSTKAKALNVALQQLKGYDMAIVLDADNVMEPDFLYKINQCYHEGHRVVQAHRVAKNKQNSLSVLDAVSEEVNNHIFRKGHQHAGMASALIGSGMAFGFKLFKDAMAKIEAIGGFDKELELALMKAGETIHYAENAMVYDEKISDTQHFKKQRTRWIAAQIRYGLNSITDAFWHLLVRGNVNYFDKSLQFLLLPRLFLLAGLGGALILTWILGSDMMPAVALANGLYATTLLIAIPGKYYNLNTLSALMTLPKTFMAMLLALTKINQAKTQFLHTPHSHPS